MFHFVEYNINDGNSSLQQYKPRKQNHILRNSCDAAAQSVALGTQEGKAICKEQKSNMENQGSPYNHNSIHCTTALGQLHFCHLTKNQIREHHKVHASQK